MGNKFIEGLSALTTTSKRIASNILILQFTIVNAFIIGKDNEDFVLIDTGLENSGEYIIHKIEKHFGEIRKPLSIILTHGHFDHVGSIKKLLQKYKNIPVYAHSLELPYLSGQKDYPLGDPKVGGGIVSKISPTFPHTSIDISENLYALPIDGSVPGLKDWKWIHTPGHTDGHICLYRERDGVLISADAISTTKQESFWSVLTQKEKISGPPKYLTTNWFQAEKSVQMLKELNPNLILPSHGKAMRGEELSKHLDYLVNHFDQVAKPEHGRFVD